jgi:CHAD domain-containing protein
MKKEAIIHVTDGHYRKLKKKGTEIVKGYSAGAIHQFRLSYKRLRAFYRLLSHENVRGEIKVAKELKKAYTLTGAIRDLQLQQLRVLHATKMKPKSPRPYLNLVQGEIDALQPALAEILRHDPARLSKQKTTGSLPDNFSQKKFREYAAQQWKRIYMILRSGHFSDENIHRVRKILKDLSYALEQFEDAKKETLMLFVWNGKEKAWFDKLLTGLGNFQDRCTSISLLRSYWLTGLNTYNRNLLEQLKKEWIQDKIKMKKSILSVTLELLKLEK